MKISKISNFKLRKTRYKNHLKKLYGIFYNVLFLFIETKVDIYLNQHAFK